MLGRAAELLRRDRLVPTITPVLGVDTHPGPAGRCPFARWRTADVTSLTWERDLAHPSQSLENVVPDATWAVAMDLLAQPKPGW